MRDAMERMAKYAAKADGSAVPAQYAAYGKFQKAGFRRAAGDQVAIERKVKGILSSQGVMVGLNHFYMDFGKKLDRLRRTYSGATLADEVCIEYGRWSSRGLSAAVLDLIVAAFGLPSCYVPPPVCDWLYKRKLTFSGNVSATDLDDFPVLVHLTAANFDFAKAQALGQDVRFMDSDLCPGDGSPLSHEIEKWDQAGQDALVWVKVPRIDGGSAADFIHLYYGNGAAADGQDVPGTWNAGYEAVWHLNALPAADSTANNHDEVSEDGTPVIVDPGKIYKAVEFRTGAEINEGVEFGDIAELNGLSNITLEAWVKANAAESGLVFCKAPSTAANGWMLVHAAGAAMFFWYGRIGGAWQGADSSASYPSGTWYHIAVTYDGETFRIYVDGAPDGVNAAPSGPFVSGTESLVVGWIGDHTSGYNDYKGDVDEARCSTVCRSADWIKAQYLSMTGALITYGPELPA